MRKTVRRAPTLFVIMVFLLCVFASPGVHAEWKPFIKKPAVDGSTAILALQNPRTSNVTMEQFRGRINKERGIHGLEIFTNDAALIEYVSAQTKVVSCTDVYGSLMFVNERTDGHGQFDAHMRTCKVGEMILVDRETTRPIMSLDCANPIQIKPIPKNPPQAEEKPIRFNCQEQLSQHTSVGPTTWHSFGPNTIGGGGASASSSTGVVVVGDGGSAAVSAGVAAGSGAFGGYYGGGFGVSSTPMSTLQQKNVSCPPQQLIQERR